MITILKKEWKHFLAMVLILLVATGIAYGFMKLHVQETDIVLVYVLAVLFIAWYTNSFIWGIAFDANRIQHVMSACPQRGAGTDLQLYFRSGLEEQT